MCEGDDPQDSWVPHKHTAGLPAAPPPFLRDSAYISASREKSLHLDAKRLAKRVALSSTGSVPIGEAFWSTDTDDNHGTSSSSSSSLVKIEDSLPAAISEYRWGVWPLVTPASSAPEGTILVQLPRATRSSSGADESGSQQRLSLMPLSVLSALRLGWLETTDSPGGSVGKGHLDLKIGGALPSLQYHVQRCCARCRGGHRGS